jgi:hypothetical protein
LYEKTPKNHSLIEPAIWCDQESKSGVPQHIAIHYQKIIYYLHSSCPKAKILPKKKGILTSLQQQMTALAADTNNDNVATSEDDGGGGHDQLR